mgnify:CR=1 FL=1
MRVDGKDAQVSVHEFLKAYEQLLVAKRTQQLLAQKVDKLLETFGEIEALKEALGDIQRG